MNSFTLEATFFGADSNGLDCNDPMRKRSLELQEIKKQNH